MRALLLVLLAGTACSSSTLPHGRELTIAQARWEARAFQAYEMEIRISCFCPPEINEWSRVRVEDGTVVGVMRLSDSTEYSSDRWTMWPTVDEIFERLEAVRGSDAYARFTATFDPLLGYPHESALIERPGVADAGVSHHIRRLGPIPSNGQSP